VEKSSSNVHSRSQRVNITRRLGERGEELWIRGVDETPQLKFIIPGIYI